MHFADSRPVAAEQGRPLYLEYRHFRFDQTKRLDQDLIVGHSNGISEFRNRISQLQHPDDLVPEDRPSLEFEVQSR